MLNWQKYNRIADVFDVLERAIGKTVGLGKLRQKYITPLKGKILEIGIGSGANIPYYNNKAEVIGIEPSSKMLTLAKRKVKRLNIQNIKIEQGIAEKIDYPNNYFDYIVSSLVFCSVDDPQKAITELCRVLKSGGRAIFIEHVASDHKYVNALLKLCNPAQKAIVGCNLQRRTGDLIRQSGLKLIKEESIKLNDVFRYFETIK